LCRIAGLGQQAGNALLRHRPASKCKANR
jgi:hypothetical protein